MVVFTLLLRALRLAIMAQRLPVFLVLFFPNADERDDYFSMLKGPLFPRPPKTLSLGNFASSLPLSVDGFTTTAEQTT